jgi:hypothetical protein
MNYSVFLSFINNIILTYNHSTCIIASMKVILSAASIVCVLLLIVFLLRTSKNSATKATPDRLSRIRNASLVISTCLWLSFILGAYWFLSFIFGWPFLAQDHARILISPGHIYSSPAEIPAEIFWLWIVQLGFGLCAAGATLRLFWLYGKGILFTAKNVNCIRFLGYCTIINWFIDYTMQGLQRDMALSTNPLFVGFFIIFIAWIMDEGRKIREEQELTV